MVVRSLRNSKTRTAWTALAVALIAATLATSGATFAREQASPAADDFPPFPEPAPLPAALPRDEGPLNVVATTGIIADLVAQIGGERVAVESLLPANADPHDFEPAPEDLVKVEEADAVFVHGLHLDAWSNSLIDNAGSEAEVFVVTRDIETIASDEEEFAEGDPHVWFDPTRVKTMVASIAADLGALDPDGATAYEARLATYQANLDQLDAAIAERIALIPADRRKMVTNHDALRYYAERYGLEIVGTVIPGLDTRTEASARDIAALLDLIAEAQVPAIFAETTTNPELAAKLAAEAGIAIVDDLYTDSLGDEDSGADTYIGLMQTDTRLIVEALR
ncbi:MAG: metal ABC transporter substrate-binding protein [Thermomicrobiales bacterium]